MFHSLNALIFLTLLSCCVSEVLDDTPCENLSHGDPSAWNECFESSDIPVGFKDQLMKRGGQEAVDRVTTEMDSFKKCFKENFDVDVIEQELEDAEEEKNLDLVFKKYCNRIPNLHLCLDPVIKSFRQYLNEKENTTVDHLLSALNASLDFICYHDGDRIALFMSEDGLQCLVDNHELLLNCSSIFNDSAPLTPDVDSFDLLQFDAESCRKYHGFRQCFGDSLLTCVDPTPGNMADSLMLAALNSTPCQKHADSGSPSLVPSILIASVISYCLL
ncbi:27 kDa glycoprotein-like isoform X1 [Artemia franciscana]